MCLISVSHVQIFSANIHVHKTLNINICNPSGSVFLCQDDIYILQNIHMNEQLKVYVLL